MRITKAVKAAIVELFCKGTSVRAIVKASKPRGSAALKTPEVEAVIREQLTSVGAFERTVLESVTKEQETATPCDDTYDHPGRRNDREAVIQYAYDVAYRNWDAAVPPYERFRDDWIKKENVKGDCFPARMTAPGTTRCKICGGETTYDRARERKRFGANRNYNT